MPSQTYLKLVIGVLLALATLHNGWGLKCSSNSPTVTQTQVGFGNPPKFMVEVQNSCPICPAIDVHVKCGSFNQALVNPRLFKVLGYNNCVVNGGLPLAPLAKISFNYSHPKFILSPSSWYFQCE
ncbi:uncharacterized protein At1g05835 [Macadamia integrifolia]|uniref:uncharacterized protein At1g05835 n=1 Tax=Macadamia integrifolia TaxID=60698 RepID=UPI001C4E5ADD|nr:uncharacterized protein At1g05835 [Macadamia integrifolia]